MTARVAIVLASALALAANAVEPGPTDRVGTADEPRPLTVRDTAREPEEVIVRPYDWKPGAVPSAETMQQIYDLRGVGACLYGKGRYEEAFPYLQAAARKGFKLAQARLRVSLPARTRHGQGSLRGDRLVWRRRNRDDPAGDTQRVQENLARHSRGVSTRSVDACRRV